MRTFGSYQACYELMGSLFLQGLPNVDRLFCHLLLSFANSALRDLARSCIGATVGQSWPVQNDPGDAGDLVGECHNHLVPMHPPLQLAKPLTEPIALAIQVPHARASAVNNELSDIGIASLT